MATLTGSYFHAHVAQHLLLMVVAPPLLALGAPATLFLQTSSRAAKTRWLGVLRWRPFAVATYPVVVWFLYFGARTLGRARAILTLALLRVTQPRA